MPVTIAYQAQYEVCALIFLFIITGHFFAIRRFPTLQNHLFGVVLICAIADLLLDIVGAYTIMYAGYVPVWVNYAVNTLFYSFQVTFPVLMMTYAIYSSRRSYLKNKHLMFLLIPIVMTLGILLLNLHNNLMFYVAPVNGTNVYFRGPLFMILYIGPIFYLITTTLLILIYRADLELRQRRTMLQLIIIIASAIVIRYFFPQILLTGVAISIAILMMFFVLQNPDDMLDLISDVFNYNALMSFLDITISKGDRLLFVAVDVGGIRRINSAFGLIVGNRIFSLIGNFLNGLDEKI